MAFYASFSLTSSHQLSQLSYPNVQWKQNRSEILKPHGRKFHYLWIVKSVLNSKTSSSISDNGASEPARILLESLFAQTQKLEEQIGRDPCSPQVAELGVNLGKLELGLQAALVALKKKEEDLQDAERKVMLEYNEISLARKYVERQEEEIVAARIKQEKLEEELRRANIDIASQATEISDLKHRLKERDQEISSSQLALVAKEDEFIKMRQELAKMYEEAANAELELRSMARLLDEANSVVVKQEFELHQLQGAIHRKEKELEISIQLQKNESEKLKVAEANLEKQTIDWLVAQEELKKLAEETSKRVGEANETMEDFGRVKKLLSDVRSELVSSQKALASSRERMETQDQLLGKQLIELEEQRKSIISYMTSLRDAEVEMQSERVKLRVSEAQNKELKRDLSMEKELVTELQIELDKERASLREAVSEMSALQEEIDYRSAAFEQSEALLKAKESELVEARLEIQHLNSEQASLQLILEEKDLELSDAKNTLEELKHEIGELRAILSSREEELVQAMTTLKEKDEHGLTMQHELDNAKLKFSEAETVVEKIVDLTKEVVLSCNDKDFNPLSLIDQKYDGLLPQLLDRATDSLKWQMKQLEAELKFTQESLRAKEMEVVAAQKNQTIKDEELKMVLKRLDGREKEMTKLKEEMMQDKNDLKQLYVLAQERVGEKSVGDLAIEKLQLDAAQLQVEAATSALQKITEMSRELLNRAGLSAEVDFTSLCGQGGLKATINNGCPGEVKLEISRLLTLTEQLVREASIGSDTSQ